MVTSAADRAGGGPLFAQGCAGGTALAGRRTPAALVRSVPDATPRRESSASEAQAWAPKPDDSESATGWQVVGRGVEQAAIDQLLDRVRSGFSASLVLRGEAGIGKTVLLRHAVRRAADLRVAEVVGIESEGELGFAGLHQLVRPFLSLLPRLPRPQRQALAATLGMVDGPPPARFLVGLAVLTLLSEAATDEALVCVVDDAQWLDQVSGEVLAFVARRVEADRIGFLFAVREPAERLSVLDGLPSLTVDGLGRTESRQLLAGLVPGAIDTGVQHQLAERAAGNPLALIELTRELTAEQLSGTNWLPDPLPLAADMQTRFVRRVAALPCAARTLLLIAAAEPSGDPEVFERAAGHLGVGDTTACPGCEDLLVIEDKVRFRHPLIRSAAYRGATPGARRRVHAAIAGALDPETDPDGVAWHRAAAAPGPDEDVAAALERSADRASSRGGAASSAAFLRRSAELTAEPVHRAERFLAAAAAEFRAGGTARVLTLLDRAEPDLPSSAHRATALHLRGGVHFTLGEPHRASATLLQAAQTLMQDAPSQASELLLEAVAAALYSGADARRDALDAVRLHSRPKPDNPGIADLLLDGFVAHLTDGALAGAPRLRAAIDQLLAPSVNQTDELRWLGLGMWAAYELFDRKALRRMALRWVELCRAGGDLSTLPLALDFLGFSQVLAGHLDAAESANAQGRDILDATGNPDMLGTRAVELLVPVWRGRESTARETAAALMSSNAERSQHAGVHFGHYALAVLELSLCNYPAALTHTKVLLEDNGPAFGAMILPEAVEAAMRCGDRATAELAVGRLIEHDDGDNELVRGLLARCRALVSREGDEATLFGEAIDRLTRCGEVSELARTHLLYGEWLRRQRRRADAREHLRTAHQTFQRLGADGFAERARAELAASGEKARKRTVDSTGALTVREAQIAELVDSGATNAEIAAQLFISTSTVEYHLRRMFQKLGVSSRTQLVAALRRRDGSA